MTYAEAIKFLYDLRWFGAKFGLENTFKLAALAGNPQDQLRFIHVAGTNGKGSTCAMLESIYRAAGLRVGLFTSPHLVSFRERIQVNRQLISEAEVVRLVAELERGSVTRSTPNADDAVESPTTLDEVKCSGSQTRAPSDGRDAHPTFFEFVTVMALKYFAERQCDLVIWETGLGGRLDSTNIVTPLVSVITNIAYDHQQWLGNTLAEIAAEKAGIIKAGVPALTAATAPEALAVIETVARNLNSPLTHVVAPHASRLTLHASLSLLGEHQQLNAALAVATVEALQRHISVSPEAIRAGLAQVEWPGRLQLVNRPGGQQILLDGAHNLAGVEALATALRKHFPDARPTLILGMLADKDWRPMCARLAQMAARILTVPVGSERTAKAAELAAVCRETQPLTTLECSTLSEALRKTADDSFVIITGSLYLVGEALELLGLSAEAGAGERALNEWGGGQAADPASMPPMKKFAGIRAVTFDVGNTLIEAWPSVGYVYAEVAAAHGHEGLAPEKLNQRFRAAFRAQGKTVNTRADWARIVDATFAGWLPKPASQKIFPDLYDRFAQAGAWKIFEDVEPALRALRKRGLALGVISNWDDRLRPLLHGLRLAERFDVIVISCEAGASKPAPAIFAAAQKQLGVPAAALLHVGDDWEMDVAGANAAGSAGVQVDRRAKVPGEAQIRSLVDLLACV